MVVAVLDDTLDEAAEFFSVALEHAVNATIDDAAGYVHIADNDDAPTATVTATTTTTDEGLVAGGTPPTRPRRSSLASQSHRPQVIAMDKLERLLNLTAALLQTPRPLSASELRERMAGAYSEDQVAFRRTFERDKADLRALGVPIKVSTLYRLDPPVEGYRIPAAEYAGRDLRFDPDELAALHLATCLVRLEGGVGDGLARLGGAAGSDAGDEQVAAVGQLPFPESLSTLVTAAVGRKAVTFSYRGSERRVEPWRLSFHRGQWYLAGWDCDTSQERLFRVDRVDGRVQEAGPAGRPPGRVPDPRTLKPWNFGTGAPVDVRVLVDTDQAGWACYRAGVDGEAQPDGSVILNLKVRDRDALRAFVVELLDHAEILEPRWLRDEMAAWLEDLV